MHHLHLESEKIITAVKESGCRVALIKIPAKAWRSFLGTTPTAAQDDRLFPLDTFSLHKHYFVLTRRELGEGLIMRI